LKVYYLVLGHCFFASLGSSSSLDKGAALPLSWAVDLPSKIGYLPGAQAILGSNPSGPTTSKFIYPLE
jgi:hypothetical protein